MQNSKYPSRKDNYSQLAQHLLNSESPLSYSLEYLLDNYRERAVPALVDALQVRPWYEQQLILETLGKLGDLHAIEPVCALLYGDAQPEGKLQQSVINTLRNLIYYCVDKKKAVDILLDTMIRFEQCVVPLTIVLKEQDDKYTLKRSYKKLFKHKRKDLKQAATSIIGEENDLTSYRIKLLKKILRRTSDEESRACVIDALKILISKKRCQRLCSKKGMRFDAFFRRPENGCYDCCCVDKNDKRVLIKFEGGLISGKAVAGNSSASGDLNTPNTIRMPPVERKNIRDIKI